MAFHHMMYPLHPICIFLRTVRAAAREICAAVTEVIDDALQLRMFDVLEFGDMRCHISSLS